MSSQLDMDMENSSLSSPLLVSRNVEHDLEAGGSSGSSCRICLGNSEYGDDQLISPCMCKGTHQYVHRSCLDHWRLYKGGSGFSHCTTCKARFHLAIPTTSWRETQFKIVGAMELLLKFLALVVSITVACFAGVVIWDAIWPCNCDDLFQSFAYVTFMVNCIEACVMIVISVMQRTWKYMLAKTEPTIGEYVVMDLRGSYVVPPQLAPRHEYRLRMLGLL